MYPPSEWILRTSLCLLKVFCPDNRAGQSNQIHAKVSGLAGYLHPFNARCRLKNIVVK